MTATVTQLSDQPILIVTVISADPYGDAREVYERTAHLLKNVDGPVYWIVDLSGIRVREQSAAAHIYEGMHSRVGPFPDPRIRQILVGTSSLLGRSARRPDARAIFPTLTEALSFVRQERLLSETLPSYTENGH